VGLGGGGDGFVYIVSALYIQYRPRFCVVLAREGLYVKVIRLYAVDLPVIKWCSLCLLQTS